MSTNSGSSASTSANNTPGSGTTTRQLCTFYLGDLLFGVDVIGVQEVLRYQEMTPVPLTPSVVRGLINLRGQIVTAIDVRARFELPPRASDELPMNVVVRIGGNEGGVVSLLVDEIGDVLEVDGRTFERAPETMSSTFRELVPGVFKLSGQLLLLLDAQRVASLGGAASGKAEGS
ncbi:MAG: chemotaxis protein CheW [Deltaproteobacteria bacterium]|nr:chemotaxis protein CheW [Deltaproteobacteria bacterium]